MLFQVLSLHHLFQISLKFAWGKMVHWVVNKMCLVLVELQGLGISDEASEVHCFSDRKISGRNYAPGLCLLD